MAARPRPLVSTDQPHHQPREAAVLLLLYEKDAEPHFLLTHRTESVNEHKGQVSLPGGAREEGEPLQQTALREAHEELGLVTEPIEVLGALTPVYVIVSDFRVHPFVAYCSHLLELRHHPWEVASVLEIPLHVLLDPATVRQEEWVLHGLPSQVPFYFLAGHKVWGATAMILSEFIELVRRSLECNG